MIIQTIAPDGLLLNVQLNADVIQFRRYGIDADYVYACEPNDVDNDERKGTDKAEEQQKHMAA